MSDIANKAGVSRTAVSHVLNDRQQENIRIPDVTRQRILDAARDLGYRPNELARAVASGKTRMIGYLVEEPRYEPHWNTIMGALGEAEELGFTMKVLSVTQSTLAERVRQCIELRLGGLIVRVNNDKNLIFEEANLAKIPVVTVDEGVAQPFGVRVAADDAPGCHQVIEHLTQLGHRRIAFISSGFPQLNHTTGDIGSVREGLFCREMAARGLDIPDGFITREIVQVYGDSKRNNFDDSSALKAVDDLLSHPAGRPTAIFCWRDETAFLAVRACRRNALRVPEDVSIVGFSNIGAAQLCDPPLSTVKSPWEEMGRIAMRKLSTRMTENFATKSKAYLIPSEFVARCSSGPVPHFK
jgi:DNA-binding LacI/PurR family transcriptional regulator